MIKRKKGVSPVVATAFLIALVIILATIIYLWASKFIPEKVEKFDKPIESVCREVNFRASINGNELFLVNRGSVPIYGISVKQVLEGETKIDKYEVGLEEGGSINKTISLDTPEPKSIIVTPVLLGTAGDKKEEYTCPEENGVQIDL